MKGTVKTVKSDKRFGFIRGEDGVEYFFHASAITRRNFADLEGGEEVTFSPGVEGEKGPRAEDVDWE